MVCDRWCVKHGVSQSGVKDDVWKMVCGWMEKLCVEELCVSKLCVDKFCVCVSKLCVDKLCVDKLCVDKLCVSKLCVDKLCVSKLCVDKLCVEKLCVSKLCVKKLCVEEGVEEEAAGGGPEEAGVQNRKQEPHTKMWGTICCCWMVFVMLVGTPSWCWAVVLSVLPNLKCSALGARHWRRSRAGGSPGRPKRAKPFVGRENVEMIGHESEEPTGC